MKISGLVVAAGAATAVATLGLPPTAAFAPPPAPTFFTVYDAQASEYTQDCTDNPPSSCDIITTNSMYVGLSVTNRPKSHGQFFSITVNYEVIDGTAMAGQDYTGTSGTVTITPNNQNANIVVPLVNDGTGESSETFTVRLTGASVPGDISDTGIATITDGSQFPPDCVLSQDLPARSRSLACTNRPVGQQWVLVQPWVWMLGLDWSYGDIVTGNGTSTVVYPAATIPQVPYMDILG